MPPALELMLAEHLSEDKVIDLFIRLKKSDYTKEAYRHDIGTFQAFVGKPLNQVTLADALDYTEALKHRQITDKRGRVKLLEDNSKRRMINSVKSLYSFAFESGFFKVNVMKAVKPPSAKSAVSSHILPETTVVKMIVLEENPRNHAILYILYASGLRVSELCALRWRDVMRRADGCQLDIQSGKGDKQRHVFLPESAWKVLVGLRRSETALDDYVFQSRQKFNRFHERLDHQHIDKTHVFHIVREAAKRAGVENWNEVSPHWLRHCHGSHSIDRGAPLSVVRDTMGHANISTTNTYIQARPGQSSAHFLVLNK